MLINTVSKWILWACIVVFLGCAAVQCSVTYDRKAIVINGQRRILISGSIHYPRSTPEVRRLKSFFCFLNDNLLADFVEKLKFLFKLL